MNDLNYFQTPSACEWLEETVLRNACLELFVEYGT